MGGEGVGEAGLGKVVHGVDVVGLGALCSARIVPDTLDVGWAGLRRVWTVCISAPSRLAIRVHGQVSVGRMGLQSNRTMIG